MVIDARTQRSTEVLTADVCIVGAGPAGLTLARELVRAGMRVCLLESGGASAGASTDMLNVGQVDSPHGYQAQTLLEGRSRQLGGSSNLWNHLWRGHAGRWVRYLPLDAIDFEERDWVPESGWPFDRDTLQPFYECARELCGVRRLDDPALAPSPLTPWELPSVEATVAQFGQGNPFLHGLPDTLRRDERAVLVLHAVLKRFRPDASGEAIEAAEVVTEGGASFQVRAQEFVLAAGGLENARVLLWHDALRRGGLGNAHGMVGRCFMDHPAVTLGRLRPYSDTLFETASFYDQHLAHGQAVMGCLHVRPEVMRRERLLNLSAAIAPRFRDLRSNIGPVVEQLLAKGPRYLLQRGVRRPSSVVPAGASVAPSVWQRMLEGYYSECFCGWSELRRKQHRFSDFRVRCLVEQSADRANRIVLDDGDADAFGQKKLRIIWKWNEPELHTIRTVQGIFQRELAAAGIGEFTPAPESREGSPHEFFSTHHFMGTTRMHVNAADGVVDPDCRVHGVGNLFVAGSSVFPTAGYANPTLTIIALALRLAGHLQEKLRAVPAVAARA